MKLVELIPGAQTDGDATDTLADFLGGELGKGVVFAKDTVKFYRNRIGCFWLLNGLNEAQTAFDAGCSMEEIDAALSKPLGVPPTGLFGLLDLIGLDVMALVAEDLRQNLPENDIGLAHAKFPKAVQEMLERG